MQVSDSAFFLDTDVNWFLFSFFTLVVVQETFPGDRHVNLESAKIAKQSLVTLPEKSGGPWKGDDEELKACWSKPALGIFTYHSQFI